MNQQSDGRHVAQTHCPDYDPTSHCSLSLMLCA